MFLGGGRTGLGTLSGQGPLQVHQLMFLPPDWICYLHLPMFLRVRVHHHTPLPVISFLGPASVWICL